MALFLVTCMPLFGLLIASLAVAGRLHFDEPASPAGLAGQYLMGAVAGLPSQVILMLLRSSLGGSYRPWRLYLSVLAGEHLLPIALAVLCYLLIRAIPALERRTAGFESFAETAVFLAGYFSIIAVADFIEQRGELTGHALFLLPLARMVTIVLYSRAIPQVAAAAEWRGRLRPVGAMLALPLVAAFEGLWSHQTKPAAATLVIAALVLLVVAATVGSMGRRAREAP